MSSFGETLKAAREAKGLTCSQVAAQTHMLVQIVEEMEREDFHRIPAPIYGRGFVRLFADCVGLDPVPLVREFMDIYEGRRAPTVSIREVPTASEPPPVQVSWPEDSAFAPPPAPEPIPEPVPPPMPEPIPEPVPPPVQDMPKSLRGLDLFEQPPAQAVTDGLPLFGSTQEPLRQDEPRSPAAQQQIDFETSPYYPYGEGSPTAAERFGKGITAFSSNILKSVRNIPRRVWRMTFLALCALIALVFIVWSVSKLYKATSVPEKPADAEPVQTPAAAQPGPAKNAPAPKAKAEQRPAKAKPAQRSAKPGKLISTGQNIPNLIRD